ncbi:MAG TPA: tripartite tricarboxylate transporter substrate binding protein [Burkholderiales bacterium]|jgi:tripartite-type tricarboxylate transporter receptor subunit TctC|nr:tripartite tricarboxylate transporter substrate binding protein [Burkholderiales bacterium]
MNRRHLLKTLLGGALAGVFAPGAPAQQYPSKPIRIIVPFAAGGANDLNGRSLQIPLGKALGGNVLVENMPGASTKIALDHVMKAAPDGYTLLLAGHGALMGYYFSGIFDYKFWDQLVLLGETGRMPWVAIEARADAPYKTWPELVEYARKHPGKLSAGGPAPGGMMELTVIETAKSAGIDVTYIPFKGGGPSGQALLGGHIDYRVAQASEVYPNVRAGKTHALGVGYPTRMAEMPEVPTFKELGMNFEVPVFGFDLWAPPGTPPAIANQITKALEQAVKDPDYIKASKTLVYDPVFTPPSALSESIRYMETVVGPKMAASFPPPKK